jgi:hypothetical protein
LAALAAAEINRRRCSRSLSARRVIAMDYFVRYARFGPSGSLMKSGWKLRLFATANEARAFSQQLVLGGWRVEAGRCGSDAAPPAPDLAEIAPGRATRLAPPRETAYPAYPARPRGRA